MRSLRRRRPVAAIARRAVAVGTTAAWPAAAWAAAAVARPRHRAAQRRARGLGFVDLAGVERLLQRREAALEAVHLLVGHPLAHRVEHALHLAEPVLELLQLLGRHLGELLVLAHAAAA